MITIVGVTAPPPSPVARTTGWVATRWSRLTHRQRVVRLLLAAVALVLVTAIAAVGTAAAERARIGNPVDLDDLPASVGNWEGEQIEIAAIIVQVAQERHIPTRGQEIAVMVAMGESSLRNIDRGDDARNPDGSLNCSLGVFQQQWCLGWGTREEVLDPAYAAGAFLDAMVRIDVWEHLEPTLVGHEAQINDDAAHYEPYFADARAVVAALTG